MSFVEYFLLMKMFIYPFSITEHTRIFALRFSVSIPGAYPGGVRGGSNEPPFLVRAPPARYVVMVFHAHVRVDILRPQLLLVTQGPAHLCEWTCTY